MGGVRRRCLGEASFKGKVGMGMCGNTYGVSAGTVRPFIESQRY